MTGCSADARCDRKVKARGMCNTHYERWRLALDSSLTISDPKERILSVLTETVIPESLMSTPCLLANEQVLMPKGYARISIDGIRDYLHRAVWRAWVGPIPDGMEIDHLCNIRHCGRIDHLECVTPAENKRRRFIRANITHCPQGHEYSSENTSWVGKYGNSRRCRQCHRDQNLKLYHSNKAQVNSWGYTSYTPDGEGEQTDV